MAEVVVSRDLPAITAGTITLTNGSKVVTGVGVGSAWLANGMAAFGAGARLIVNSQGFDVASLNSATQLTLEEPWTGATTAGLAYKIYTKITPEAELLGAIKALALRGTDQNPLAEIDLWDSNQSHPLAIAFGSDVAAKTFLTLLMTANRTLTINGNATIPGGTLASLSQIQTWTAGQTLNGDYAAWGVRARAGAWGGISWRNQADQERWNLIVSDDADGNRLYLNRWNPAGANVGELLDFSPATGQMRIKSGIASTTPATGSLLLTGSGGVGVGGNINALGSITSGAAPTGRASLSSGGATEPGSVNFHTADGTRRGYVGWSSSQYVLQWAEAGWGWLFGTNSVDRMAIDSNGAVRMYSGIAATSPTTGALQVAGGAGITGNIYAGGDVGARGATSANVGAGACFYARSVDSAGIAGLAVRAIEANGWSLYCMNNSGVGVGGVYSNPTNTSFNTASDYRVKLTIGEYDCAASLDLLDSYCVHKGVYIAELNEDDTIPEDKIRPMLIAHEVQAVSPHAVHGAKDAEDEYGIAIIQQMDRSQLVDTMIAWIKGLRAIQQNHAAEIAALTSRIDALEA